MMPQGKGSPAGNYPPLWAADPPPPTRFGRKRIVYPWKNQENTRKIKQRKKTALKIKEKHIECLRKSE